MPPGVIPEMPGELFWFGFCQKLSIPHSKPEGRSVLVAVPK